MKKTLVALTVAAFAASSAHAFTAYDAEGTKVEVDGSLRLTLERASNRTKDANGRTVVTDKTKHAHTTLRNTDSRFGVRVKHDLAEDFYALGRLEIRFDKNSSADQFGDLYAKRAYIGLGSKKFGEVTFGRQLTIADDYGQTDDYAYGIVPAYIETSGTQVIRYDYKGIEGLQVGANYNFAEKRNAVGEVLPNELKNAYGLGAVYETQLANEHVFNIEGGVGRSNYVTNANHKHHQDGYEVAAGYTIGPVKLVADLGYKYEKAGAERTKAFYVAPGVQYQVIPASRIYGNYLYERSKTTLAKANSSKEKTHGFLLGVDYKFHKQVVAYVEGKYVRTKDYNANNQGYAYNGKTVDKAVGVGMRVFW